MKVDRDQPIVLTRQLVRTYGRGAGRVTALRGIDFAVPRGSLVVLRGRSGSGKTTLLNLLGGLDRPTSGEIWLAGRHLGRLSERALSRIRARELGFVFQAFSLLPTYSAIENVELALRLSGEGGRRRKDRALEVLALVGMVEKAKHRPFELSGGEQQRVVIARALANRPVLLLADEPTGQLDSGTGRAVLGLFRSIVDQQGVSTVLATHDPAAGEVADLSYYIRDGKLVGDKGEEL